MARHLTKKRNLGIVTPVFTDALMDLVKSGAVTNRCKGSFRGKCLASYAIGTPELMQWLDNNPFVEFQGIDVVGDPIRLGRNDNFIVVLPARKIDLTGNVVLGSLDVTPSEVLKAVVLFPGHLERVGGL